MSMIDRQLSKIEKRLLLIQTGPGSKCVRLTPDEIRAINESLNRVLAAIARGEGRETLSPEDQYTFDINADLEAEC